MKIAPALPRELADVAYQSESLSDFGLRLREWNHYLTRSDVSNRLALALAIKQEPEILAQHFPEGQVADAYLAAYAEWIADQAGVDRPTWVGDPARSLEHPWFADNARASLLILAPASFRQRNLFTIPEQVVRLRRGRARVSAEQKKAKARKRDQGYRERQKRWLELGRKVESLDGD